MLLPEDLKLCYVEGNLAYFTTYAMDKQTGDDWDDSPYQHNAGPPYSPCWHNEPKYRYGEQRPYNLEPGELCVCSTCQREWNSDGSPKWDIVVVGWYGEYSDAAGLDGEYNVYQINAGVVPWLSPYYPSDTVKAIFAGCSLQEFIDAIESSGGTVMLPRNVPQYVYIMTAIYPDSPENGITIEVHTSEAAANEAVRRFMRSFDTNLQAMIDDPAVPTDDLLKAFYEERDIYIFFDKCLANTPPLR